MEDGKINAGKSTAAVIIRKGFFFISLSNNAGNGIPDPAGNISTANSHSLQPTFENTLFCETCFTKQRVMFFGKFPGNAGIILVCQYIFII